MLLAIHPRSDADHQKLARALGQLSDEDPTFSVEADRQTDGVVLGAAGELQLEIVVDRLKREFDVDATLGRPQVAYKQALTLVADGEARYAPQTGDRGEYAHVTLRASPGQPGTGIVFEGVLTEAAVPSRFLEATKAGIWEAARERAVHGYEIVDVRVELWGVSFSESESSEAAFGIAGAMAFSDAVNRAGLIRLEPVMHVEVVTPDQYTADIVCDLVSRRGRIQSNDAGDRVRAIRALVPLSELFGYHSDLRSRTLGRATHSVGFARYEPDLHDPGPSDGDRDSLVGAPLRPVPKIRDSAVALPEPDDDNVKC